MAAKVVFVNVNDKSEMFKVNLFGSQKNQVKVASVLGGFKSSMVIMADGTIIEADEDGLSVDTFDAGETYEISIVRSLQSPVQTSSSKSHQPLSIVKQGQTARQVFKKEPSSSFNVITADPYKPGKYNQNQLYERIYKKKPTNMKGYSWRRDFLREYHPLQWKVYNQNVKIVRSWFYEEDGTESTSFLKVSLRNQQELVKKVKAYITVREPSLSALLFNSNGSNLFVRWQVDDIYEWFKAHKHYIGSKGQRNGQRLKKELLDSASLLETPTKKIQELTEPADLKVADNVEIYELEFEGQEHFKVQSRLGHLMEGTEEVIIRMNVGETSTIEEMIDGSNKGDDGKSDPNIKSKRQGGQQEAFQELADQNEIQRSESNDSDDSYHITEFERIRNERVLENKRKMAEIFGPPNAKKQHNPKPASKPKVVQPKVVETRNQKRKRIPTAKVIEAISDPVVEVYKQKTKKQSVDQDKLLEVANVGDMCSFYQGIQVKNLAFSSKKTIAMVVMGLEKVHDVFPNIAEFGAEHIPELCVITKKEEMDFGKILELLDLVVIWALKEFKVGIINTPPMIDGLYELCLENVKKLMP